MNTLKDTCFRAGIFLSAINGLNDKNCDCCFAIRKHASEAVAVVNVEVVGEE
jgi:hypothetical protein